MIGASIAEADALAYFYSAARAQIVDAALVAVALFGAGGILLALLRRQERASAELAEKSILLESVFATSNQGIAVFDRNLYLGSWNELFTIFFVNALTPRRGMPLEEMVQTLAASGEYGEAER